MTKPWRPRLFGNQPYMMDPLHIALYYAHKDIEAKKQTAMEWLRSDPTIPSIDADKDVLCEAKAMPCEESRPSAGVQETMQSVPANAQRLADEAARRIARASWSNTRMLLKAMGVKP